MTVFILNLHHNDGNDSWWEKHIIYDSAMQYKEWYDVPKGQRFSNRKSEFDKFTAIGIGSLSQVGINDKLMIFGHGSLTSLGPYCTGANAKANADALADDLVKWGLTHVGIITFKACFLAGGDFLDWLTVALASPNRNVHFGWIKGYTGVSATAPKHGLIGKPTENISKKVLPSLNPPGDLTKYRVLVFKGPEWQNVNAPKTHNELMIG